MFLIPHFISTLLRVVDCSGVRPLPTGGVTLEPSFPREALWAELPMGVLCAWSQCSSRDTLVPVHPGSADPGGPLEKARVQTAPLEEASIGQ